VNVKFPWPIGNVAISSWGKTSDTHTNSGTYHYSVPSVLAGLKIPLTGSHTEPGVACAGAVLLHFKGGGLSNPLAIGTFILTVISGAGLVLSFRPKGA
jgi:hypothetical protein